MIRYSILLLPLLAGCGSGQPEKIVHGDTVESIVELDYLKSKPPDEWKEQSPKRTELSPVIYHFRLPGGKEDDAELHIFRGIRGSVGDNITRWKGQFVEPPPGKNAEEAAVVTERKIGGFPATVLDIRGTFLKKDRPFDPSDKGTRLPNYRMIAIHFEGPRDVYQIRLRGPESTIEQYRPGFEAWLAAFK